MPVIRSKNLIANKSTGGCKKQGLAPSTGKSNAMRQKTLTKASANDKTLYCINQLGGIGRFRSSTVYSDSAGCFYSIRDAFNDVMNTVRSSTSSCGAVIIQHKNTQYVSFYNNTVDFYNINTALPINITNNGFHGFTYYVDVDSDNNDDDGERVVPRDYITVTNGKIIQDNTNRLSFTKNIFTNLEPIHNLNTDKMYLSLFHFFKFQNDDDTSFDAFNNAIGNNLKCDFTWSPYNDKLSDKYNITNSSTSNSNSCEIFTTFDDSNSDNNVEAEWFFQYNFKLAYSYTYNLKSYKITIKSFNQIA